MCKRWTERWMLLACMAMFAGCATDKEALLTHDARTMREIWDAHAVDASQADRMHEARQRLRRPLDDPEVQSRYAAQEHYTRTAQNEIARQFHRLPNPDLVMFVFPHLAGTDPVPIPGYSTVFPFYQRVQYALPGERTEDY